MYLASDCLWLLREIHKAMSRFEHTRYPPMLVADAYAKFFRFFQGTGMTDTDYMTKYQEFRDLFDHFQCDIGKDRALVKFEIVQGGKTETEVDNIMKDASCAEYKAYAAKAQERFFATCFLRGSNKTQFGALIIGLENDYAQGANKFPKTVTTASNIKQTFRQQYGAGAGTSKGKEKSVVDDYDDSDKENEPVVACAHMGSLTSNVTPTVDIKESAITLATLEFKEDVDNMTSTMSLFDYSFLCAGDDVQFEETESTSKIPHIALVNTDVSLMQPDFEVTLNHDEDRKVPASWILLDNESTVNIFRNRAFLTNIHTVTETLRVYGTGGFVDVHQKGTLPGFGLVWYSPTSIANILSFADVEDHCRIEYNQQRHQFAVTNSAGKTLLFNRKPPGRLYYLDASRFLAASRGLLLTNVDYSPPSIASHVPLQLSTEDRNIVDRVEPTFRALGCPNPQSMLYLVRHNKISNLPFKLHELERYLVLLNGSHPDALAGHMTRKKPKKVVPWIDPVPKAVLQEFCDVILCGDLFFIPKLKFLITVADKLEFITGHNIPNKELDTIFPHLEAIIHLYRLRGYRVVWLLTDMEFAGLQERLLGLDVRLNITSANEHVGRVERCIRTIKEDVRTILASLPFNKYPLAITREAVLYAIYVQNLITRRHGPGGLSPSFLVQGIRQTHGNSCELPYGTPCYIPTNETQYNRVDRPRGVVAISLRPLGNVQGGYTFLQLHNWQIVARYSWKVTVYTEEIL